MRRTIISLGLAFLVAALVWIALPADMYVEKAGNIIVLAFIGVAVVTWLMLKRRRG